MSRTTTSGVEPGADLEPGPLSTLAGPSVWRARADLLWVAVPTLAWFLHRLAIVLSAGDFLFAIEASEAKNTQFAWDLMTGRFGSPEFGLPAYVANSGHVHHASYSSTAVLFVLVSKVLGWSMVAVRTIPLLFGTAAVGIWLTLLKRHLGGLAALVAGVGLVVVTPQLIGVQLSFQGCHPESVLPLAVAIAVWTRWRSLGGRAPLWSFLAAFTLLYAAVFSYLLWPLLFLVAATSLIPPVPRPGIRDWGMALVGIVLGLWPLALILSVAPVDVLFTSSITENPASTVGNQAAGAGVHGELLRATVDWFFGPGGDDPWTWRANPWTIEGGEWSTRLKFLTWFGPLSLLPFSLLPMSPTARRLTLLTALGPTLTWAFLIYGSPLKPDVPPRYFTAASLIALSAPGVLVGVGRATWRHGGWGRGLAWPAIALGLTWTAALVPLRTWEQGDLIRPERWADNLKHRYVEYYNAGMGTVWARQVVDANQYLDVRAFQARTLGTSATFHGTIAGFCCEGTHSGLQAATWDPPKPSWFTMGSGLNEWKEAASYGAWGTTDYAWVARNLGWGIGLRTEWQLPAMIQVMTEGQEDEWSGLPIDSLLVWEGLGFGLGRTASELPASADALPPTIPAEAAEAMARGMAEARALGPVPRMALPPPFPSAHGPGM